MNKIFITLIIFLFNLPCKAEPLPVFKHFSDYTGITPTKKSDPSVCRTHFNAVEKINDRTEDPAYKTNQWKLVMRRGVYRAQVDAAMSELYRYFLGYSTDVDYVEEKGDYFIARREFKHFNKFDEIFKKENSHYFINGYELQDNGLLTKDNQTKTFSGLAKAVVLADFFADTDAKSYNFGLQENENEIRLINYDLEAAFSFDDDPDQTAVETNVARDLGDAFVNMTWYQREKTEMRKKLAETDFSVIEKILRKHITVSQLESRRWFFEKILRDPTVFPTMDRKYAQQRLDQLNQMDDKQYDVDRIIEKLRARHNELKKNMSSIG